MNDRPIAARRRLLLAGAGALVAGCASPVFLPAPPGGGASPVVRVGDRWRYAQIDLYRNELTDELTMDVVEAAPLLRVRVVDAGGTARPEEIYESAWRVIQEPSYGDVIVFGYPNPVLPTLLDAGGSERIANRIRAGSDELWHLWTEWIDAPGWEAIRVPAGEFVALRVRRRINFESPDPFRFFSTRYETLWYAPQVKRWVRREWTGQYYWAGMTIREAPILEDRIAWELLEHRPA
jgi:hypothetical protein